MYVDDEFQFVIIRDAHIAFTQCQMFGFFKNAKVLFLFRCIVSVFLSY